MRWVLTGLLALTITADPASAQGRVSPFGIYDNSFLVEEAFNQEPGIFQNIFVMSRLRPGEWQGVFTQEWPLFSQRHQLSYTMPIRRTFGDTSVGDLFVNYRFQVWDGEERPWAFAPRISMGFPTSEDSRALDNLSLGWQFNLPVSYEWNRVMVIGNAGATWVKVSTDDGDKWSTVPFVAGSFIWAARRMLNPLFEVYSEWTDDLATGKRASTVTFVPGVRGGWNIRDQQVVVGIGFTITRGDQQTRMGGLAYLSYELPFRR